MDSSEGARGMSLRRQGFGKRTPWGFLRDSYGSLVLVIPRDPTETALTLERAHHVAGGVHAQPPPATAGAATTTTTTTTDDDDDDDDDESPWPNAVRRTGQVGLQGGSMARS